MRMNARQILIVFTITCFSALVAIPFHEAVHGLQCQALNGTPEYGFSLSNGYDFFSINGTETLPSPATYCRNLTRENNTKWNSAPDIEVETPAILINTAIMVLLTIPIAHRFVN